MIKNKIILLFIFLFLLLFFWGEAFGFSGRVRNVLSNIDTFTNYESIVRIDNIKSQPNTLASDEAILDYVQAVLYEKINFTNQSEKILKSIINKRCAYFGDYSIFLLADIYINQRKYTAARELLTNGLKIDETNLKVEYYLKLIHITNLLKEDVPVVYYEKVINLINNDEFLLNEYNKYLPEFVFNIATSYKNRNLTHQALVNYINVIFSYEDSNFALRSVIEIDNLLKNNVSLRRHAESDVHRKMVEIYINNRYYNSALTLLNKLRSTRETKLFMVDCYLYRGEYDAAMSILRQVSRTRESYLKFAKLLKFRGQLRNSKSTLMRNILSEKIYDNTMEEALMLMIEILLDEKSYEEAQKYYVELYENYPSNGYHSKILWVFGKGYFANERYREAEKYFEQLLTHLNKASSEEQARATFWQALSIEKQGRYVQASNIYNQIIRDHIFSYYAYRSLEKINYCFDQLNSNYARLNGNEKKEYHTLQQNLRSYYMGLRTHKTSFNYQQVSSTSATGFRRFYEHNVNEIDRFSYANNQLEKNFIKYFVLKQLGKYEHSILELKNLHHNTQDDNLQYNLALLYCRNSENNKAIRIIENTLFTSNDYTFDIQYFPNELKEILYPMNSYRTIIERYAQYYNLNPLLVRAIIREESRFYYRGRSSAGAIGLMQIIPSTGRWIAQQLGYSNFRPSNLYQPSLNVRFGTYYFHNLMEKYNREIIKSLAAYNGGRGNVDKWTKTLSNDDIDYFVEMIPFNETRRYVKNVLKSFYLYSLMNNGLSDFDVTLNNLETNRRWE